MFKEASNYMYSTAAEEVEVRRLVGLNKLHNPYTLRFLSPLLGGRNKVLELGCGSGHLAADLLKLNNTVHYIGVDRDPAQVKCSREVLQNYSNIEIIELDIISDIEQLKKKGPFDLIYCRWLLVHIPIHIRVQVIKKILELLSEIGVFLCDECDNRDVQFKPASLDSYTSAPYQHANLFWSQISLGLMGLLNNDLELTPKKISNDFATASDGQGEIKTEGQYHVVFSQKDEKRLITDGYRSSSEIVSRVCKKPFNEMIAIFDACVEDENIEIRFLTQHVVTYKAQAD